MAGIKFSADAIRSATANAALNGFPKDRCAFRAGDASDVFATIAHFPRRDARFVEQLLTLGPGTVAYVSCNGHTQARDVGMILRRSEEAGVGPEHRSKERYVLESLRGFDLFLQTAHVESVVVLRLVSEGS